MGCASSKRVEASVAVADVYRPPPASIALFDISKIEEPWIMANAVDQDDHEDNNNNNNNNEKIKMPTLVTLPFLEKLDSYELAPKSWSEVSKALEELKPAIQSAKTAPLLPPTPPKKPPSQPVHKKTSTLVDEPDAPPRPPPPELSGSRPVQQNSFLLRDRQERESKKKEEWRWKRRDPLEGYPERPPPGNPDGMVLYTTTLRGVRRTFEDCERARRVVEGHALDTGVEVDERDVSLHGEYLKEMRELVGEGAAVPRLFVRGRYVGGVDEVVELSETGKLREMLRSVAAAKGGGGGGGGGGGLGRGCQGCGGARFVPCLECNGSCKLVAEDGKGTVRCGQCNENGLVLCPVCH